MDVRRGVPAAFATIDDGRRHDAFDQDTARRRPHVLDPFVSAEASTRTATGSGATSPAPTARSSRGPAKTAKKGRPVREIVSLRTVKQMRPERDEIIVCTGVNRASSGAQYRGSLACGFLVNGNAR